MSDPPTPASTPPVPAPAAPGPTAPATPVHRGLSAFAHVAHAVALAGIAIQAVTGFGEKLGLGEFAGWRLLLHMCGAGLFVAGFTAAMLLWLPRARGSVPGLGPVRRTLYWLVLAAGLAVMWPVLVAMLPLAGPAAQEELVEWHEAAALTLVVLMVPHTVASVVARLRR